MAETEVENTGTQGPPNWFVRPCKWLWKKQGFIWGTLGLGVALNVFAGLLLLQWPWTNNKSLDGTLIKWGFQNPPLVFGIGLVFLLLFFIIYLGSRFEVRVAILSTARQKFDPSFDRPLFLPADSCSL